LKFNPDGSRLHPTPPPRRGEVLLRRKLQTRIGIST
jgi:hypothetical protein